jgi:hypothetical protein
MVVLGKHEILAAKDSKLAVHEVPEWGGEVCIRVMCAGDRDQYEIDFVKARDSGGMPNFRTRFLVKTLCDDQGNRLFTDADVQELTKKNSMVVDGVWKKAMQVNGLAEGAVEEAAGN